VTQYFVALLHVIEKIVAVVKPLGENAGPLCAKLAMILSTVAPFISAVIPPPAVAVILAGLQFVAAHGTEASVDLDKLSAILLSVDPEVIKNVPAKVIS